MRLILFLLFPCFIQSQINWKKKKLPVFDTIYSEKIHEDSLQSTFFIAIKKNVALHFHQEHSECIVILEGKGEMTLGKQVIKLQEGMQVNIPKNTIHGVNVTSRQPLRVISIQSPLFDGKDRHFVKGLDF